MAGESNSLFDNLPAPTAAPTGWWDSLFGEPQRRAAQPQSRGALLGMGGYQNMPTSQRIQDRRQQGFDYTEPMVDQAKTYDPYTFPYDPSPIGGPVLDGPGMDSFPLLSAGQRASDVAPYKPSYSQNMRPQFQTPYQSFPVGPNLPSGPVGISRDSEMPYLGPHLPISPGDPGWTPPPSLSGPHNPNGDPDRPGYGIGLHNPNGDPDRPGYGIGQISPQQMQNALQLWQTGQ